MLDVDWITSTPVAVIMVVLTGIGLYVTLMLCTRIAGLRSFSKMSGFDFPLTIAVGSLIATVVLSEDPPLLQGGIALITIFSIQFVVSFLRSRSDAFGEVVDNNPLLLMAGSNVLHDNLKSARVTLSELRAKLREANVIHTKQVRAVVMETTGDISVLHAEPDGPDLDLGLLSDVRGAETLRRLPNTRSDGGGDLEF